jgi:hypothetical protein
MAEQATEHVYLLNREERRRIKRKTYPPYPELARSIDLGWEQQASLKILARTRYHGRPVALLADITDLAEEHGSDPGFLGKLDERLRQAVESLD